MIPIAVAALLVLVVLAGAARAVTAPSAPARVDGAALAVAALAPSAMLWSLIGSPAAAAAAGCAGMWFLWRVAAPAGKGERPPGTGRGAAVYRLLYSAVALWASLALNTVHHAGASQELATIIQHMAVAVILSLSCAGWLLGTFAMPKDSAPRIQPALGVQEALAAVALALCLFSIV